jgi:abhydrolase domain-containing protein 2
VLTENVKSIIMKHRHILLSDDVKRRFNLNEGEIAAAATLQQLDESYTRKIHNFSSASELYKWSSCINYLKNIELPVIFINSMDDPLVPDALLQPIRNFAGERMGFLGFEWLVGGGQGDL